MNLAVGELGVCRLKEEHVGQNAPQDRLVVLNEHDEIVIDREHIARYGSPWAFSLCGGQPLYVIR